MFAGMDIFVYSGTGNTYKAAQSMGEAAKTSGTECSISMIDVSSKPEEYQPSQKRLLGLMAPTMGAIQPMSFFGFILRLPRGKGQKVFLAATGAGEKIGPLFIPGYVGFGLYLAALFLLFKGYKIVGITGFGMPRNWTTLIPPNPQKLEDSINGQIGATAGAFAKEILSGKRVYKRIADLIVTLIILPLPILYSLFGRFFLAKTMFAGSSCTGCGLCADNCPRKAIKMYGKKPYWTFRCEQCMRCAGFCPKKAVDCNSFIILAYIVFFSAVPAEALIIYAMSRMLPAALSGNPVLLFLVYYAVVLLAAAAIYAVFYLLSRIPFLNKVFTCLSFTHYWRKYRQPSIHIKTLTEKQRSQAKP